MNVQFSHVCKLPAANGEAKRWLTLHALPHWYNHGIDKRRGGFHDMLDMRNGRPIKARKRAFVQARQVYSFLTGAELGWEGPSQETTGLGLHALEQHFAHPDWGYVSTVDHENKVRETGRNLYDQAFVAFAKATAASCGQRVGLDCKALVSEARVLLGRIATDWTSPHSGYYEGELVPSTPKRQNPHMHLLEASIALARASGDPADLQAANSIADFATTRLIDRHKGILPEYFSEDWKPIVDNQGRSLVEPGHHFEWAWLLCQLASNGGNDHRDTARRLWEFGRCHGIDAGRGVAIDQIDSDGSVISARARLWPQTERLKAALAMMEWGIAEAEDEAEQALLGLFKYLQTPVKGLFYDRLNHDGTFEDEPARASSIYHIACAISELDRVVR